MTWVKSSDDELEAYELRTAGKDAAFLFVLARGKCAKVDGDGLMPPLMVKDAAGLYDLNARRLTPLLVESGRWHDFDTVKVCEPCMADGGDRVTSVDLFIHDWRSFLLDARGKDDEIHRWREQRKNDLKKRKEVKAAVRKRDRDLCRYCGMETRWDNDHRSEVAGTYDHIDPFCTDGPGGYGNTVKNLVVACHMCNSHKKDRTPEQWVSAVEAGDIDHAPAFLLRPEPGKYRPMTTVPQPSDQWSEQRDGTDATPGALAGTREGGRTPIRPGSDPGLAEPGSPVVPGLTTVPEGPEAA